MDKFEKIKNSLDSKHRISIKDLAGISNCSYIAMLKRFEMLVSREVLPRKGAATRVICTNPSGRQIRETVPVIHILDAIALLSTGSLDGLVQQQTIRALIDYIKLAHFV